MDAHTPIAKWQWLRNNLYSHSKTILFFELFSSNDIKSIIGGKLWSMK